MPPYASDINILNDVASFIYLPGSSGWLPYSSVDETTVTLVFRYRNHGREPEQAAAAREYSCSREADDHERRLSGAEYHHRCE